MPFTYSVRTVDHDGSDFLLPAHHTDSEHLAMLSATFRAQAHPTCRTVVLDTTTGETLYTHEPLAEPTLEVVGLYPHSHDGTVDPVTVFSRHDDPACAWSAFEEALLDTDPRTVLLRHTTPGNPVLASSEHPPYRAIYDAATRALVWS